MRVVDFTKEEYDLIESRCNFNKYNGEYEVYKLLKDGAMVFEIAQRLNMSERTVSRRKASIMLKVIRAIH